MPRPRSRKTDTQDDAAMAVESQSAPQIVVAEPEATVPVETISAATVPATKRTRAKTPILEPVPAVPEPQVVAPLKSAKPRARKAISSTTEVAAKKQSLRVVKKDEPVVEAPEKPAKRRVSRARRIKVEVESDSPPPTLIEHLKELALTPLHREATRGVLSTLLDPLVSPAVERRIRQVPSELNEYGFDAWGLNPMNARYGYTVFNWLYNHYFRVTTHGIENIPPGRVLLISNHSGQLPIDGVMIGVALLMEGKPPRMPRAMVERWFTTLPVIGNFLTRHGGIVGDPLNCKRLLERGEAITVFPEGIRGSGKLWKDRYKLMQFGLGFMRLALETKTPIVPVGVIGGEEQAPSFVDVKPLANLLGLPYFPITPTFPWLGALGVVPYPTKYSIYFGKPLHFRGDPDDWDEVIQKKVDVVKDAIRGLLDRGLEERESIF